MAFQHRVVIKRKSISFGNISFILNLDALPKGKIIQSGIDDPKMNVASGKCKQAMERG